MNAWHKCRCRPVSFCQVDGLMFIPGIGYTVIAIPAIGQNRTARIDRFKNEWFQAISGCICNSFQSNTPDFLFIHLGRNSHQGLAYSTTAPESFFQSADVCFINFNGPRQFIPSGPDHSSAQFVQHKPSSFITSQSQYSFQPKRTGSVFLTGNPPYSTKPDRQRYVRSMENSPGCDRYLMSAFFTAIQFTKLYIFLKRAVRANESFRPSKPEKIVPAILLITIFRFKFHEITWVFFDFHAPKNNIW